MLTSNEKLDAGDAQARAARRLTGQWTHELRQIRPRCSYGSAIWVEVTDAVCVDKVSCPARARVWPPETRLPFGPRCDWRTCRASRTFPIRAV